MNHQTEIELKFLVPRAARAALMLEMSRGAAALPRKVLAARYLDTPDRRLAREGLAWRLRREDGRWVQTLKAAGKHLLERFEHEVIRPDSSPDCSPDAAAHAGTPAGDRLWSLLRRAQADGVELIVRVQTDVKRSVRRLRLRGAVVEVSYDEGRLLAAGTSQRICEIEFELKSGSITAMLALAERWRKRFGLVYDPRSKSERGDRLADGSPHPAVRKAAVPIYSKGATTGEAFGAVLDECLAQSTRNALGLAEGDPACRVEHVHQLRVGMRRLRSALRSFEGWVGEPPSGLVDDTRALFAALGRSRDSDVMDSGVVAELARAGAPPLSLRPATTGPAVSATIDTAATQKIFLAWIAWRIALTQDAGVQSGRQTGETPRAATSAGAAQGAAREAARDAAHEAADKATQETVPDPAALAQQQAAHMQPREFRRSVEKRLRKWHKRIAADLGGFDNLDEASLHALRKRVKRQRYAVEFFSPLLRARRAARYLRALAALQDRMGALNDLFVARARYQALVATDAAAWFALGWLAASIAQARSVAKPALAKLAKAKPPTA